MKSTGQRLRASAALIDIFIFILQRLLVLLGNYRVSALPFKQHQHILTLDRHFQGHDFVHYFYVDYLQEIETVGINRHPVYTLQSSFQQNSFWHRAPNDTLRVVTMLALPAVMKFRTDKCRMETPRNQQRARRICDSQCLAAIDIKSLDHHFPSQYTKSPGLSAVLSQICTMLG